AYPGRVFHGAIDLVASTLDPALRTVRVRCSLPNAGEELKPEMYAEVTVLQPPERRIAVPRDAVVAINEGRYVYVQAAARPDGRVVFKRRPVAIGDERDGAVPILDGLARGERVVIAGAIAPAPASGEAKPTPKQLQESHITTARVETRDIAEAVQIGG